MREREVIRVSTQARSRAPVEAVWRLVADGVGAIRRFRTGRVVSREEVVVFEPPTQFGYRLLSGLPLVNYRSTIELVPEAGRPDVLWVGGGGWRGR
ncbi:MAG: SRPBCC family protein, partial [Egibacteraceae bacterium]